MKRPLLILIVALLLLDFGILQALRRGPGEMQVHMLNIGQGDSLLLRTVEGHQILVDGGPDAKVLQELGAVMSPAFKSIDLMVLTHPHADHINGLIPVLDRFEVKAVLMTMPNYPGLAYDQFLKRLKDHQIPVYSAEAKTDFRFGEVTLNVLYPFEPISGVTLSNVNNASPVIRVESPNGQILLMGDAEQEVESALLAKGVDLEADILKAGHHGSKTSSTLPFLEAVDPKVMLISDGIGNDYGHPSPTTLEKAATLDIEVRRTDLEGRITLCVQSSRQVLGVFDRIVRIRGPCKSRH